MMSARKYYKDVVIVVLKYNSSSTVLKSPFKLTFLTIASLCLPLCASADERPGLLLNATVSVGSEDNVLNQIDGKDDQALKIAPVVQYFALYGKHKFVVDYQGTYAAYSDDSNLNYDDHDFSVSALFDHSHRMNSELELVYQDKIEQPGTNNSSSELISTFNEYSKKIVRAKLYYGTEQSIGQFVLGLKHDQLEYKNNNQSFRDNDRNEVTATFFYRVAPKMRVLIEARNSTSNYANKSQFTDQSSSQQNYLAGVTWNMDAQIAGTLKAGYLTQEYDSTLLEDISGLSYSLDVTWKPSSYTEINALAARSTRDSSEVGVGGYINTSYSLAFSHELTARTSIQSAYTINFDEIPNSNNREDKRNDFSLGIKHDLHKWFDIALDYHFYDRVSDNALFEYDSNKIELSFITKFN